MKQILACSAIGIVLVSAGCSTGPRRGAPAPVVQSQPAAATAAERVPESKILTEIIAHPAREPMLPEISSDSETTRALPVHSNSPAVLALLSNAGRQQLGGELVAAAATVERALRIEPRNARLWHRLASLRLDQKRYRMAADLAAKSNSLSPKDAALRRSNWQLISLARAALGDSEGARRARQQAQ